jgi:hypothetical protein
MWIKKSFIHWHIKIEKKFDDSGTKFGMIDFVKKKKGFNIADISKKNLLKNQSIVNEKKSYRC